MILVSACLLGRKTKYDGGANPQPLLMACSEKERLCAICPECSAALPVPRPPAEIIGGDGADVLAGRARVVSKTGEDISAPFVKGAETVLQIAREKRAAIAILKARSPSCGVRQIYDGTFTGARRDGSGVAAALLREAGVSLYSEEDLTEEALRAILAEDREKEKTGV